MIKKCILCGKEFEPKSNAQKVCDDIHYRSCEVCGKQFVITRPSSSQKCCSKECTKAKRESTMLNKYGVKHALQDKKFIEKAEDTSMIRYGVKHAAQSDEVKNKVKEHFKDKYGVDTPFQMDDFWDKAKQTNLDKYGTEYAIQNKDVKKKAEHTCIERYGCSHSIQSAEIKHKIEQVCLDKYGVPYPCMTDQCRESSASVISKVNKSIANYITELTRLSCSLDKVKLDRFSYDLHVEGTNILIEVDPTYTHNCIGNHWDKHGLDKYYHINKTQLANEHGYRCIHLFDWDNIDKVIHMVSPKHCVFARKCELVKIDSQTASKFENIHHLQGACRGQDICLGLYYNDELIEVMTFGKPRYNKHYQWELLRLCTHYKYKVIGGASKLFKYFINNYSGSIISYCDRAKFNGYVYQAIGMSLKQITEPQKVWSKNSSKITDNLLRQRGYDQLFGTSYGKGTSNQELMVKNSWLPVYDCGQLVYEYTVNN